MIASHRILKIGAPIDGSIIKQCQRLNRDWLELMHKPLNASLFSVIDIKASHWFEPSQAHGIFEF